LLLLLLLLLNFIARGAVWIDLLVKLLYEGQRCRGIEDELALHSSASR
jgi:hypothetical protein